MVRIRVVRRTKWKVEMSPGILEGWSGVRIGQLLQENLRQFWSESGNTLQISNRKGYIFPSCFVQHLRGCQGSIFHSQSVDQSFQFYLGLWTFWWTENPLTPPQHLAQVTDKDKHMNQRIYSNGFTKTLSIWGLLLYSFSNLILDPSQWVWGLYISIVCRCVFWSIERKLQML